MRAPGRWDAFAAQPAQIVAIQSVSKSTGPSYMVLYAARGGSV